MRTKVGLKSVELPNIMDDIAQSGSGLSINNSGMGDLFDYIHEKKNQISNKSKEEEEELKFIRDDCFLSVFSAVGLLKLSQSEFKKELIIRQFMQRLYQDNIHKWNGNNCIITVSTKDKENAEEILFKVMPILRCAGFAVTGSLIGTNSLSLTYFKCDDCEVDKVRGVSKIVRRFYEQVSKNWEEFVEFLTDASNYEDVTKNFAEQELRCINLCKYCFTMMKSLKFSSQIKLFKKMLDYLIGDHSYIIVDVDENKFSIVCLDNTENDDRYRTIRSYTVPILNALNKVTRSFGFCYELLISDYYVDVICTQCKKEGTFDLTYDKSFFEHDINDMLELIKLVDSHENEDYMLCSRVTKMFEKNTAVTTLVYEYDDFAYMNSIHIIGSYVDLLFSVQKCEHSINTFVIFMYAHVPGIVNKLKSKNELSINLTKYGDRAYGVKDFFEKSFTHLTELGYQLTWKEFQDKVYTIGVEEVYPTGDDFMKAASFIFEGFADTSADVATNRRKESMKNLDEFNPDLGNGITCGEFCSYIMDIIYLMDGSNSFVAKSKALKSVYKNILFRDCNVVDEDDFFLAIDTSDVGDFFTVKDSLEMINVCLSICLQDNLYSVILRTGSPNRFFILIKETKTDLKDQLSIDSEEDMNFEYDFEEVNLRLGGYYTINYDNDEKIVIESHKEMPVIFSNVLLDTIALRYGNKGLTVDEYDFLIAEIFSKLNPQIIIKEDIRSKSKNLKRVYSLDVNASWCEESAIAELCRILKDKLKVFEYCGLKTSIDKNNRLVFEKIEPQSIELRSRQVSSFSKIEKKFLEEYYLKMGDDCFKFLDNKTAEECLNMVNELGLFRLELNGVNKVKELLGGNYKQELIEKVLKDILAQI
jgi:hypothetical protein